MDDLEMKFSKDEEQIYMYDILGQLRRIGLIDMISDEDIVVCIPKY